MNRKKRIILTLSVSLLVFISICLSVGLIRQRQKNTNEIYKLLYHPFQQLDDEPYYDN